MEAMCTKLAVIISTSCTKVTPVLNMRFFVAYDLKKLLLINKIKAQSWL